MERTVWVTSETEVQSKRHACCDVSWFSGFSLWHDYNVKRDKINNTRSFLSTIEIKLRKNRRRYIINGFKACIVSSKLYKKLYGQIACNN